MTNETEVKRYVREEAKKTISYKPIEPNASYDRTAFVKAQGNLNDLGGYVQSLVKSNATDLGARRDLCSLLIGKEEADAHIGMPAEIVMEMANESYSAGSDAMARYIETNFKEAFDKFKGDNLKNFVTKSPLPLYATKNDAEHNDAVELILDVRDIESKDEERAARVQAKMIDQVTKDKEVAEWARTLIQRFAGRDAHFVGAVYNRYAALRKKALSRYLTNGDKPDETKLRNIVKTSMRSAYDKFDDVPSGKEHDGERNDIWEQNIRPCYLITAQNLRPIEKKEIDKDDSGKKEEKGREKDRQSLGMAA